VSIYLLLNPSTTPFVTLNTAIRGFKEWLITIYLFTHQKQVSPRSSNEALGALVISNWFCEIDETTSSPALVLWFFDSRGGFDPTGIKPYNVDASVVNWFRETNLKLLEKWGRVPALAYFHIPTWDSFGTKSIFLHSMKYFKLKLFVVFSTEMFKLTFHMEASVQEWMVHITY